MCTPWALCRVYQKSLSKESLQEFLARVSHKSLVKSDLNYSEIRRSDSGKDNVNCFNFPTFQFEVFNLKGNYRQQTRGKWILQKTSFWLLNILLMPLMNFEHLEKSSNFEARSSKPDPIKFEKFLENVFVRKHRSSKQNFVILWESQIKINLFEVQWSVSVILTWKFSVISYRVEFDSAFWTRETVVNRAKVVN